MPGTYIRPAPLVDVLRENIDEAAFLYSARKHCLSRPDLSWENLAFREKRLEAHLHSLALGGMSTARLLKGQLALENGEDPGLAFVAGAVYPSLGFVEPMEWLTATIAAASPGRRPAIEGLIYTNEDRLEPWLGDYLVHENPFVRAAGAEVLARRRSAGFEKKLAGLVNDPEPRVALAAAAGLPRELQPPPHKLIPCLALPDPEVVGLAARSLIRSGNRDVMGILRRRIPESGVALNRVLVRLVGVVGDGSDARSVIEVGARQAEILPECLLTLGLLGSPQVADHLIRTLSTPAENGPFIAACQALHTLSGKDYLPDFDLDEPPPGAVAAYQDRWRQWRRDSGGQSSHQTKYRLGQPLSPSVLLADLIRRGNPNRDLNGLELQFHFECPIDLHADARYPAQVSQLDQIKTWVERGAARSPGPVSRVG